jgi:hypothetical protein
LDDVFYSSDLFKIFKGNEYIMELIKIIKNKMGMNKVNVVCK